MRTSQTNPLTWLAVALVVAIVLMAAFGALSVTSTGGYYGMMGGGMGWGLVFMGVPAIILIVILVAALGGLTDRPAYGPYPAGQGMNAVEILDHRYARSELSREEYVRMRTDLLRGNS